MKEIQEYEKDLASIRNVMERSVKFISLSGLSGILSGAYALGGAWAGYYLLNSFVDEKVAMTRLCIIAAAVLALSLGSGYLLSLRKAKKLDLPIWSTTSRQLLIDLLIPLLTGGALILILISQGSYVMVSAVCLIFYGLALLQASRHTYEEIRYLGLTEIALGLLSALLPGYGLILWALGFGVMHIVYGAVMHFRYDR